MEEKPYTRWSFTIVLELDPDTSNPADWEWHSLLDLGPTERVHVESTQVVCKLCHNTCEESEAHRHQYDWVCPNCWDDRLRATE